MSFVVDEFSYSVTGRLVLLYIFTVFSVGKVLKPLFQENPPFSLFAILLVTDSETYLASPVLPLEDGMHWALWMKVMPRV